MEIGKLLKEKFGFEEADIRLKFTVKYGYSNAWLNGVLNDQFPELNHGHLIDISEFTGLSMERLLSLQTPRPDNGIGHPLAPPGKPWVSNPIFGIVNVKDIKEVMKESTPVLKAPEGFILVPIEVAEGIVSEASIGHDRNEFINALDKLLEENS